MPRKLKYHESKLLKKTDFFTYKQENPRRAGVIRRYSIQNVEDYDSYNKLCGLIRQLAHRLSLLPPTSAVRRKLEQQLLDKLHDMGILGLAARLSEAETRVTVSAFARRRLPVVMARLHQAQTVQVATTFIEGGQVRVGVDTVTDPAFLVTRRLEDYVTWTAGSKIKRHILKYRDKTDDFETA